jgi:hypothetical protein
MLEERHAAFRLRWQLANAMPRPQNNDQMMIVVGSGVAVAVIARWNSPPAARLSPPTMALASAPTHIW